MAVHGSNAKLYISDGPSASAPVSEGDWIEIDLAREGTFNQQREMPESTSRKSGFDTEHVAGHRSRTYDFTAVMASGDDAMAEVLESFYAEGESAKRWFRDRPLGEGDGLPQSVFQGMVSNASVAQPAKDVVTMSVTIQVSGTVSQSVQSVQS